MGVGIADQVVKDQHPLEAQHLGRRSTGRPLDELLAMADAWNAFLFIFELGDTLSAWQKSSWCMRSIRPSPCLMRS